MSCFLVPLAQAVATSVCRKTIKSSNGSVWVRQLPTLEKMLWGGSLVLIVDHIAHGELFTFNLMELLKVGVPMSLVVTLVWAIIVLVKSPALKRQRR
ncbi:MAG: hypothetical protein KBS36_03310 [Bacteroidales bacterium]|nr:hypothetical protein [Candidatus Cryptobacteroides fimicaballi]